MLADQAERILIFRRGRILDPEGAIRLEVLAEPRRFDRGQPVVDVVEQMHVPAERLARRGEQLGDDAHIFRSRPEILGRQVAVCGLVEIAVLADAIGRCHPGHAALQANRLVSLPLVIERRFDRVGDRRAIGMAIDHAALARRAAEQLIDRQPRELALDVPQGHVDRRDRRHRHGPATPIGALIEKLPDILDPVRVAPDQTGDDMLRKIGRDCQLAAVERRIADAGRAVVAFDLQRREIPARRGQYHPG